MTTTTMADVTATAGSSIDELLSARRVTTVATPRRSPVELALSACALGMWRLDFVASRLEVSDRFKQVLGHEHGQESWDAPWDDLSAVVHPDDKGAVFEALDEHLDGTWPFDVTCRCLTRHGDYRMMRLTGQAEWAEDGTPLQVAGTLEDVSARVRMEGELVASEARFRALFDEAPYGLVIEEASGARYENPALRRMGIRLAPRVDRRPYGPTELLLPRADRDRALPVRVSGMPLSDGRMLHVVIDISAEVEARAREEDLQRELVTASRLAGMAEMATGVLHNLGNVLNSAFVSSTMAGEVAGQLVTWRLARVVEHLNTAADVLDDATKRAQLVALLGATASKLEGQRDGIVREVERVRTTLEHARAIVSAQQEMAKNRMSVVEKVAVDAVLTEAWTTAAAACGIDGIDARTECLIDGPIEVDRHTLLQILVNLLINATQSVRAVEERRGEVTLVATPVGGGRCRLAVRDNGVGIAAEDLGKLFTHGYTTKATGRGFGLHHSAMAAGELGGRLWAESEGKGRGATFILELPLAVPLRAGELTGRHQRVTPVVRRQAVTAPHTPPTR